MIKRLILALGICLGSLAQAQEVNWMSFAQLDSALNTAPKSVMIKFVTDWCVYCKKMDQEVFTDSRIIKELNQNYYAVSFDAESDQIIRFDGQQFDKKETDRFHSLAMLLAAKDGKFAPPVVLFLDDSFMVQKRDFAYIPRKQLLKKLIKYSGN